MPGYEKDLYRAACDGNVVEVEKCLARGTSVNCKPYGNQTPLHIAKNKDVAEILIQNGADVNSRDSNNQTSLHLATSKEVAEILIQNGADVNSRDSNNKTLLHVTNSKYIAEILILNGADVNSRDSNNKTPLHITSNKDVAEMLILNGADVNSKDSNNNTPLHLTINKEITEMLIQNGADVNSRDCNNQTPLHWSINIQIAEILIQHGADVYSRDNNEKTPLGCIEEKYVQSEMFINNETMGDSALHQAANLGDQDAVKTLIRLGANVLARNTKGLTPYDIAERQTSRINKRHWQFYNCRDIGHYLKEQMNSLDQQSVTEKKPKDYSKQSSFLDTGHSERKIDNAIQLPWLVDGDEFHAMLSRGEFQSYEHRLSLGGPCKAGKSTLASVLIDEEIPLQWNSTDGLVIFFGRNGIDIENRKMVPLKKGERGHEVLAKVLRGNPDVSKKSKHLVKTSITNTQLKAKTNIEASQPGTTNTTVGHENDHLTHQPVAKPTTNLSMTESELEQRSTSTSSKCVLPAIDEVQALEFKELKLQSDILDEVRNGQYKIEIAPSDLVDFGGQKSYDMTHQLFIQHSGSFLLMFDGRYGLHKQLDLAEYPEGVTAASIFKHWVDSILTYAEDTEDIMPMILFAATHRDQCKEDMETLRIIFIRDIKEMFSQHEKKSHIHLNMVYFINGIDKNDMEIERMTEQVVMFAMKQSSWGQRRPMQWVPLEIQISNMRMKNINIIAKEDLRNVNKLNGDLALNERQLEDFLLVQHSLGKLMYYNISGLDKFIIVHPPAMVNILRSFVTDRKFFPTDQNLKSILERLTKTGTIYKTNLLQLWQQDQFNKYMPENATKEFVLKLLIHLDILVIPKALNQQPSATVVYLVPCMIKAIRSSDFNLVNTKDERTISLKYSIARHSIPASLAYKLIATAVNAWPLKSDSNKLCLYHKAAVLNVSEDNELRIWIDDNQVIVSLTNEKSFFHISPDIAASVQECMTKNIELALLFHYNSFGRKMKPTKVSELYTIEVGIPCGSDVCFQTAQAVMKNDKWICGKGKEHESRYVRYWFFNKTKKTCGSECKGLTGVELQTEPSDKHLVRLGSQIEFNMFREFYLNLGMELKKWENTQSTYVGHSSEGIMAMALKQWNQLNASKLKDSTLKDMSDALMKANLNSHLICQIFRENTELFEIADLNLQKIPRDQHLKELSNQIGNCPLQLGIELGLSFVEVEQSLFRFPKDLPGLVEDILVKWKTKSKVKTAHSLMMALGRVEAGGVRYLREISKLSN